MDTQLDQIRTSEEYDELLRSSARGVIYFRASWAQPCAQMDVVLQTLRRVHSDTSLVFRSVDVDSCTWVSSLLDIAHVPTFILFANSRIVDHIEGAHAAQLTKRCAALVGMSNDDILDAACKAAMNAATVVLFMKGSPDAPRCGFSRQMVALLREAGIVFKHVDVLKDQEIRERIKIIAQWPTFPQLFAYGQLVGGLDIARELADAGTLVREIESLGNDLGGKTEGGENGNKSAAWKHAVDAGKVDGVEEKGNIETQTPQESVNNAAVLGPNGLPQELNARLEELVQQKPVMLFMKGSPDAPRCGFSRKIVDLLGENGVKEYGHFDILTDNDVRQGLKKFSQWPTFPQLYAKGELLGGLDIAKELAGSGALLEELGLNGQETKATK